MTAAATLTQFNTLLDQIGNGVPNAEQYQRMSSLILDFPEARTLARMDPFKPDYKAAAMDLYLFLRGRADQGYVADRDEPPATELPTNLWSGLIPWSFGDASMASEHVLAWGHILSHVNLPKGGAFLEYGPGSGQLLLMIGRMGYRACGVDIDQRALDAIEAQAQHLNLPIETERAAFGQGFSGQTFDTILFYEAFHHAFEFEELLTVLHTRLKPGGRIILCGEPVVHDLSDGIPYPWGPRLDALSVFCIRRFGWMELGFTHAYLMQVARRRGWSPTFHSFANCGRAAIYVLEPGERQAEPVLPRSAASPLQSDLQALQNELASLRASTSWRVTVPLRATKKLVTAMRRRL